MKKLNHPPINDWLLSEDPLSPEQTRQLQDHLQACQECNQSSLALAEVRYLFKAAGQFSPLPGFTTRWQERLTAQHEKLMRRNAWILFGVAAVMAVLILSFLMWRVFGLLKSPAAILTSVVYLWTFAQVALKDLSQVLRNSFLLLPSISLIGVVFFTGFCSMVSVLWFATVRKFTLSGRLT